MSIRHFNLTKKSDP